MLSSSSAHVNVTGIYKLSLTVFIVFQRIEDYTVVVICKQSVTIMSM